MWQNSGPVAYQQWKTTNTASGQVLYFETQEPNSWWIKFGGLFQVAEHNPRCERIDRCLSMFSGRDMHDSFNQSFYPVLHKDFACTAMVLTNLADPIWISVKCNEGLLKTVYCLLEHRNMNLETTHNKPSVEICLGGSLVINATCVLFLWHNKTGAQKIQKHVDRSHHNMQLDLFKVLEFVSDAINSKFPPLFTADLQKLMRYTKCSNTVKYDFDNIPTLSSEAFIIKKLESETIVQGGSVFVCSGEVSVSSFYVCDGNNDCPGDASDEVGCFCSKTTNYTSKCKYLIGETGKTSCSFFYLRTVSSKCQAYSLGRKMQVHHKKAEGFDEFFWCQNGQKISRILVDDLVADCGLNANDEPQLMHNSYKDRTKGEQLACRDGHVQSYNFSEICTYKLNKFGHLVPCRTGEHVRECSKFQCNVMFKCPGYYCIPWSYVCDSKWDCPFGLDENITSNCRKNRTCRSLFKCRGYHSCIHLGDVCDGNQDCPHGDDEYVCVLRRMRCPLLCDCYTFSLRCFEKNVADDLLKYNLPYHKIFIQNAFFNASVSSFVFREAIEFSMTNTNLADVCSMVSEMTNLLYLDTNSNAITIIEAKCFQISRRIRMINLSRNLVSIINNNAFVNQSLMVFNLTDNCLSVLHGNVFTSLSSIVILSIEKNMFHEIHKNGFGGTQIRFLETDIFQMCCLLVDKANCTAPLPWYISCSNLLPSKSLQAMFYVVSMFIVVASMLSLILQRISFKKGLEKTGAYGSTVASVNTSDLVCAIYIITVWAADLHYQDKFWPKEQWKSSPLCFVTFAIILNFSFLSPLLLSFLSFSRLMVVLHPIDSEFKRTKFVVKYIVLAFVISTVISISLTVVAWVLVSELPVALCSPFIDPTDSLIITKVLIWLVTLFQLTAAIFIVVVYITLITSLRKSQKKIQESVSKRQSNMPIIIQILAMTSSNILCWIPSGVIFLVSMFQDQYPTAMLFWITAIVMPINSIVNPIIFIRTTMRKITKQNE